MNTSARSSDGLPVWVYGLVGLLLVAAVVLAYVLLRPAKVTTAVASDPSPRAVQPKATPKAALHSPALPKAKLTPGDVLTTDVRTICVPGYTQTVRNVPTAVKRQVYTQYGIASHKPGEYEVDHLISLELGGSNSLRNLWPESYIAKPLNAHVKDVLEDKLHDLVCAGKLPIETAQKAIAQNWVAAYQKYVGPLPSR